MSEWTSRDLTIRQRERLERLHRRFGREPLPPDLPTILKEQLAIDFSSRLGTLELGHPFMVAPGEWTGTPERVAAAAEAGWAAVVLRTAAAWGPDGDASLAHLRARPGPGVRNLYHPSDVRRERPALIWDRRLDSRGPEEYLEFVRAASNIVGERTAILASLASAADRADEELAHAGRQLLAAGADALEALWSPGGEAATGHLPKGDSPEALRVICADVQDLQATERARTQQAFHAAPALTLDFGTPIVGGPRTFRPGDLAGFLREWNLEGRAVAAAGGVYSGRDALAYILAGASAVQVYSYIAGRVRPVLKQSRNKFEQVLYRLLLDPRDGLAAGMAALKNRFGISRLADAVGLEHKTARDA
ncbi:MAG: hypothetical protein KatS3mg024_1798 [Armatimonadota bacterium]|nr:MAG: hypothetical protein KatS3mg024_1798 [Armatimonadota bacterium]